MTRNASSLASKLSRAAVGRTRTLTRSPKAKSSKSQQQRHDESSSSVVVVDAASSSSSHTSFAQVESIAHDVGVRLTPNELYMLRQTLKTKNLTGDTARQFETYGQDALQRKTTREVCLDAVANPENPMDKWGVRVISFFDYAGTSLFAIVGTQVAGDVGMNLVGCCLVGCVAALGGGSVNAVLYGAASPLLGRPGVRWVANPSYLIVAMVSSVLTFFAWPYYCEAQANHYLENVIGKDKLDAETGNVSRAAFLETWQNNAEFRKSIRDALPNIKTTSNLLSEWKMLNRNNSNNDVMKIIENEEMKDGSLYFSIIDQDNSGDIDMQELMSLVERRFYNGWETYWLDTLGLTSLSIAAVIMAIRSGIHPLVAATSGVTVCFGGIMRDLLCGRDLAIGSQSYALCTGFTSTMYIVLRELALRRIVLLPLVFRTFVSAGSGVALRGVEWYSQEPLLRPMHGQSHKSVVVATASRESDE